MPTNDSHSYKPQTKKWSLARIIRRIFRFLVQGLMLAVLSFFIVLFIFRWVPIPTSAFIYHQNSLAKESPQTYSKASYKWQSWDDIPMHVALAVVAAEDQRFPNHWGIDMIELKKALAQSGDKGPRGASTITQQTAKNLFLWNGRSYTRKVIEAFMSIAIEMVWSKQRILEVYLNIAQFGGAIYGIKAASEQLFDKKTSELTREDAALLAVVLPRPAVSNINNPSANLRKRQQWVLKQMKQLGGDAYLRKLK